MGKLTEGTLSVQALPGALQPSCWAPALDLQFQLEIGLDAVVHLWLTNNRRSMVSLRTEPSGAFRARLHYMFTWAGDGEVEALIQLATGQQVQWARRVLREFTTANRDVIRTPSPSRRVRLRQRGRNHDLAELLERAARAIDEPVGSVAITWGRYGSFGPQTHIRLGSYSSQRKLIRIHPLLDRPSVPGWVIEFVIFHELLHRVIPPRRSGTRHVQHGADFRARESKHPDFERFKAWVDGPLQGLMARTHT